ncbi:hypothetical protein NO2_1525 [Candidatus Termititenax persephonae]|uniref:Uncharacterized protein n=1 Tax=Candidatus Termititenax persephonae TaxID=2218525 RepID=A0A388TJV7_9BACT|nr:hypothetical protein NO2_1525 [Candidatus Termititenax persephonae]
MAAPYTGGYDGIGNGQLLSAESMTAALNQMEKVANKVTAADWDANKYDDVMYPSCAAMAAVVKASYTDVERLGNRVACISELSTDDQYPTVQAVTDAILRMSRLKNMFSAGQRANN